MRVQPTRLLAAYFDKPLFPENFSASEMADEGTGRSLRDWVTFYEGGKRLVEYLKHVGYNGAVVCVARQGSTIYPSLALNPTPKYDTGTLFSTGQDPVRKDVLEMLFRLFDREGLKLVPAVQFSSTLGDLEASCARPGNEAEGIRLTGARGERGANLQGTDHGMAPHYNPLDPRVQDAMRQRPERTDRSVCPAQFLWRSGGADGSRDLHAACRANRGARIRSTRRRFEQSLAERRGRREGGEQGGEARGLPVARSRNAIG